MKAISLKPDYHVACNNLGNTLRDQGKFEEAVEAYNKALSIKPDYDEAYKNTLQLLKIYSPVEEKAHILFITDSKIKKTQ